MDADYEALWSTVGPGATGKLNVYSVDSTLVDAWTLAAVLVVQTVAGVMKVNGGDVLDLMRDLQFMGESGTLRQWPNVGE